MVGPASARSHLASRSQDEANPARRAGARCRDARVEVEREWTGPPCQRDALEGGEVLRGERPLLHRFSFHAWGKADGRPAECGVA
jgi:hypothetical protein